MNTTKKLAKNTAILGISNIATSVIGFMLLVYLARYLGEIEFGKYCFAISFTTIFSFFLGLGIDNYLIRELARDKSLVSKYVFNLIVIKLILSLLAVMIILIANRYMNFDDKFYIICLFGVYTIISSFFLTFKSLFQSFELMEYDAISTILSQVILFLSIIFVLTRGYKLTEVAYIYILVSLISIIICLIISYKKFPKITSKIDFSIWKFLLLSSIPFGLNALFGVLYFRIGTVMLSFFQNDYANGIYNAAYTPLLSLGIIPSILAAALYPTMSRLFISSKESVNNITEICCKYMAIIGFPIAGGCFLLANEIIAIIYNNQFSESVIPLMILAFFLPIRWISSITGTHLTSINQQDIRTICVGISMSTNILLNIIMIPLLSFIGASLAMVLSEITLYILFNHFIKHSNKSFNLHKFFIRPMISTLIMISILYICEGLNIFLQILLGMVIYFFGLLMLGAFTKEEIEIFRCFIRND